MNEKNLKLTDTIIVAYITIIGYLITYFYEKGISEFYGYPKGIIDVSLQTFLKDAEIIFVLMIIICSLVYLFVKFMQKNTNSKIMLGEIFLWGVFLLLNLFSSKYKCLIYLNLIVIISVIIWGYGYPIIKSIKNKTKQTKVEISKSGLKIKVIAVLFGFLATTLVSDFSYGCCSIKQLHTLTYINNETYIVANIYNDVAVIAPIDLETNIVTSKYKMLPTQSIKKLEVLEIGSITVDKVTKKGQN